jgi:hypothetical protein
MFSMPLKKKINPIIYNPRKNNANKVILFTNARNEARIGEWAAHHLLLGFDNIVIFDHKSTVPIASVLSDFNNRIIIKRCDLDGAIKIPLMKTAVFIAKKQKADWMLYLDADEFLCLNAFSNIKQMLKYYHFADSLGINWVMFGSNHHVKEPKELMVESYTKSVSTVDQHVKSFVRPETVVDVISPHYFEIYNCSRMFGMPFKKMKPPYTFNSTNLPKENVGAYIAHYVYQSEETYIKRKVKLPSDDGGTFRSTIENIHIHYNIIENNDLKNKYANSIKELVKLIIRK